MARKQKGEPRTCLSSPRGSISESYRLRPILTVLDVLLQLANQARGKLALQANAFLVNCFHEDTRAVQVHRVAVDDTGGLAGELNLALVVLVRLPHSGRNIHVAARHGASKIGSEIISDLVCRTSVNAEGNECVIEATLESAKSAVVLASFDLGNFHFLRCGGGGGGVCVHTLYLSSTPPRAVSFDPALT